MHFATLQCLDTPGYTKYFNSGLQGSVLGCNVGNGLSLFILVHPAQFYSMGHDHESMALNTLTTSDSSCPCRVFLPKSLGRRDVSSHKDVPSF
jgi:hypothetical protein